MSRDAVLRAGETALAVLLWVVLCVGSSALALTVLSFIMLGDAVRDALDPKARQQ